MSSIAFHTPEKTLRISGRERAMMGDLCHRMLRAQLGLGDHDDFTWVEHVTCPGHYLHTAAIRARSRDNIEERRRLRADLLTYLNVGDGGALILDGESVDLFELNLNSAIEWGSRPVRLAAKLHGQCEIHGYCEGEDRAWLAEVIEEGVDGHVFRDEAWGYDGWTAVAAFLRSADDQPVVTSYSVCESFPNPEFMPADIEFDPDDPYEAWSNFSEQQHWEWGMAALRVRKGLRISPETINWLYHGGLTGAAFIERAREIERASAPLPPSAG